MPCDGNCKTCPIQCGASTLAKLESNKKESKMSEGATLAKAETKKKLRCFLPKTQI